MVALSCLWKVLVCSQGCMQHGVQIVLADDNWGSGGCTINTGLAKELRQPELITESTNGSRNLSCIILRSSCCYLEVNQSELTSILTGDGWVSLYLLSILVFEFLKSANISAKL